MISNISTDIEKKIDNVIICLPFGQLSVVNQLKNKIPPESDLQLHGSGEKIRILPGDANIDFRPDTTTAGTSWRFNLSFDVVDNTHSNFKKLNFFTNKKVVTVISSSTYRYQIGNSEQPLDFSFRETLTGFDVTISGQCYFPAARQIITSFRTSS